MLHRKQSSEVTYLFFCLFYSSLCQLYNSQTLWKCIIIFILLDTLTFDQHMVFFSEFVNVFSLEWYSTLTGHNYFSILFTAEMVVQ